MILTTTKFTYYGVGQAPTRFQPGDIIFTHQTGIPAELIRVGQFIRYHGEMKKFAHWNHVAMVVDNTGTIIEAVGRGVSYGHIDDYKDVEYVIVSTKLNKQSREQSVAAMTSFLKDKYGWLTITSITLQLLTGIKIQFSSSNSKVCSTAAAMALWAGGVIFDRDPNEMMPADLASAFNVEIPND